GGGDGHDEGPAGVTGDTALAGVARVQSTLCAIAASTMLRHMAASPTAAMDSSGSRAVWRTASASPMCSRQTRSTLSPACGSLPLALLLYVSPASTRAMRSTSGRLDSGMSAPPSLRSLTRLAAFGFGRRHSGDLARGVDQLDREHRDDGRVVL